MSTEETVGERSAADTLAVVAMSLLTAVAVVGNLVVLLVIVRSPSLRVQLTNFFVINLCVVDLVAATVVMPLSLSGFNTQSSTNMTGIVDTDRTKCSAFRILSTIVVFTSVMSIALANVERYVSIRYPMQHAAHLTVGRTLATLLSVWAAAVGVAATPVVADWNILDVGTQCCTGSTPTAAVVFTIVVVSLLFVAPTLIMAVMCCSIYRVARQAGRQIVPGIDDGRRPPTGRLQRRSSSTVTAASCSVVRPSVSCTTLNNIQPQNDAATVQVCERNLTTHGHETPSLLMRGSPECIIRITSHETGATTAAVIGDHGRHAVSSPAPTRVVQAQMTAGVVADRRWKAAATLLFVLLTFVPLWLPYFAYSLYTAVYQMTRCGASADHVETLVVWIGFVTFASNAFVYGWMNRVIREALGDACGQCPLAARGRARLSQVFGDGDAEDFLQFLERTSSFDRTQSVTQSSELTAIN